MAVSVCAAHSSVFPTFLFQLHLTTESIPSESPHFISLSCIPVTPATLPHLPPANVSVHPVRTLLGFTSQLPCYQDLWRSGRKFNPQRCFLPEKNEKKQWVQTVKHFNLTVYMKFFFRIIQIIPAVSESPLTILIPRICHVRAPPDL